MSKASTIILTMIASFQLSLICNIAIAASSGQILEKLKHSDEGLMQGSISFDEINLTPNNQQTTRYQLYYSANGQSHLIPMGKNSQVKTFERVADKYDGFNIANEKKEATEVIFSSDARSWKHEIMWNIIPAPCFAIGRGLSTLSKITMDTTGNRLKGLASDGTLIEALLDPSHGYVAKEIKRKVVTDGGKTEKLITKWVLGDFRDFGNGIFISTNSTYKVQKLSLEPRKKIAILKASFKSPNNDLLSYNWHKKGLKITDSRLGNKIVTFKAENLPANITPSELFLLSAKQISEQASLRGAADKQDEILSQESEMRLKTRFAIIVVLVVTLFIVSVKFRKHIKENAK